MYKELHPSASDLILNAIKKNVDKSIVDLNKKFAGKAQFALTVDGEHPLI